MLVLGIAASNYGTPDFVVATGLSEGLAGFVVGMFSMTAADWGLEVQRLADKAADFKRQAERATADKAAGEHATTLETLSRQLGGAHAQIALLSRRQCLGSGTVRMLNGIGATTPRADDVRAATGDSASAAPTSSPAAHDAAGYASERDVATEVAICRVAHAMLVEQINRILDIDDYRFR